MSNELRERVVLRVDGGMRSGRDVLVTAALGGDEYGFGTVAMIATGCIMVRPHLTIKTNLLLSQKLGSLPLRLHHGATLPTYALNI